MKKYIAILTILIVPAFLLAQETPLSALYAAYVSEPDFETTEIMPGSTGYEWEKNIDAGQLREIMRDIESVRILEYDGEGKYNPDKLWKKMTAAVKGDQYTEVVRLNSDEDRAFLYLLPGNSGTFREIALLVREKDEITMVTVTGNLDFKKMLSAETMKNLRELGDYYMHSKGECEVK